MHPVQLLIKECHRNLGHFGREAVATQLKQRFHIVAGNKIIRKLIKECTLCKKVQGKVMNQIMADLPRFTHTGTDLFGPFYVSNGRTKQQEKRYGIIFTCLSSRAAHLELTRGLDVDSYINAYRRFICRRGSPKTMRSDNGTNLTAANKELKQALKDLKRSQLDNFCIEHGIDWKFQPPNASHFGGVFEREIRSVRKILSSIFQDYHTKIKITDDILATWFCEVENILNCRPLTAVTTDEDDLLPLTANDLLRLNSSDVFPFGLFTKSEDYIPRRWRQAQHLSDIFWGRFRLEYLPLLQERHKWQKRQSSLQVNDIVLIVDKGLPRNNWPIGKVVKVKLSDDNEVRSCDVSVLRNKYVKDSWKRDILNRPISKLILLYASQRII